MRSMGVRAADSSRPGSVPADNNAYEVGQRVRHAKFGIGTVSEIENMAADKKIAVQFDDPIAGRKTLLGKFAKLEILE